MYGKPTHRENVHQINQGKIGTVFAILQSQIASPTLTAIKCLAHVWRETHTGLIMHTLNKYMCKLKSSYFLGGEAFFFL